MNELMIWTQWCETRLEMLRRHLVVDDSERGSVTLEQALITAGLVAVAVVVLAAITAAVSVAAGRIHG